MLSGKDVPGLITCLNLEYHKDVQGPLEEGLSGFMVLRDWVWGEYRRSATLCVWKWVEHRRLATLCVWEWVDKQQYAATFVRELDVFLC